MGGWVIAFSWTLVCKRNLADPQTARIADTRTAKDIGEDHLLVAFAEWMDADAVARGEGLRRGGVARGRPLRSLSLTKVAESSKVCPVPRTRQLSLALAARRRWGGKRKNAGRKAGENHGLPHGSRERFLRPVPAHVTLHLRPGLISLRTVPLVREIERSFARGCERSGFRLVHYSLQGNHAHLIVEAHDREALGRGMMAIGSRLARAMNRVAGRSGPVLAERYHLLLLATPRQVRNALRYVLLNGRHHAAEAGRRISSVLRLDPASSARWFDGWKREKLEEVVREDREDERPAVARARTWLLAVGWRRWGLLDPAYVPG